MQNNNANVFNMKKNQTKHHLSGLYKRPHTFNSHKKTETLK